MKMIFLMNFYLFVVVNAQNYAGNQNNLNNTTNINISKTNTNNVSNGSVIYYDTFTGNFITVERFREHVRANNSFWCTGEFTPCDPYEGRRVDGTCNNLNYPTRGAIHTPHYRLLPPEYDEVNFVLWKPYCCLPRGRTDRDCVPNMIPEDDPVHQFSGIRCQNMTRPRSFQSAGCIKNDTAPIRIVSATPAFDLSNLYGNNLAALNRKARQFEGGLLKTEEENGKIWPPSVKGPVSVCYLNERPRETRCHNGPEDGGNGILGSNLFSIWLWRHHNFIATQLRQVNPCWDDERLFQTARDINIAYMMQIYYYELLADLLGYKNLVNDGVLSQTGGFRDLYDPKLYPQISLEFPFSLRWAHLLQGGKVKMYDSEGYYLKEIKMVNLTLRTGYLVDNLEFITQGAFRQPGGKIDDYIIDPDIGEKSLGPHQRILDVTTNDLAKNRYFGFAPYVKYKEICFGTRSQKFEDLLDLIDPERVELLAEVYKNIEDIDLIAGMWLERRIYGSASPTFYCIIVEQLRRTMVSDRHWYERPNRPNAFTLEQLLEIRKATIARMLCDVGDTVTEIQPKAFLRAGPHNKRVSCDLIPGMDYNVWKDYTCRINTESNH